MDRLAKVEKLARAQSAATSCQLCPDTMCLTCCRLAEQSTNCMSPVEMRPATPAKSTPKSNRSSSKDRSSTGGTGTGGSISTNTNTCHRKKSASKSNSVERPPKEKPHPRRLSQKSKSEIEFDPGFYMQGYNEQAYRDNKCLIETYKPLPPPKESKMPGRFFSRSRPESINCEQYGGQYPPDDCPYCSPQAQKKTKILPCGCVCEYTSGRKASSLKELSGNKK